MNLSQYFLPALYGREAKTNMCPAGASATLSLSAIPPLPWLMAIARTGFLGNAGRTGGFRSVWARGEDQYVPGGRLGHTELERNPAAALANGHRPNRVPRKRRAHGRIPIGMGARRRPICARRAPRPH